MAFLEYTSPTPLPAPFPRGHIITSLTTLALAVGLYTLTSAAPFGFPGPRTMFLPYQAGALLLLIVGEYAAIKSLHALRKHSLPRAHLLLVLLAALTSLLGIPAALLAAESELRFLHPPRPPYLRLSSNGKGMGNAVFSYAAAHSGHYPPHLAALLLSGTDPRYLASPGSPAYTPPVPLPPESDWPLIAPAVDASSAFTYTGADLTNPIPVRLSSQLIIAYSKPNPVAPGHRVLLFADGHTEYVPDAHLPKVFNDSNTARANLKLPPFTLDVPPPKPPLP